MINIGLILLYLLVSNLGLFLIKSNMDRVTLLGAVGFAAYVAGFLIWLVVLKRLPLSIAFPVMSGALVLTTQFVGKYALKESLDLMQWIGVGCVLLGITIIFSRSL